MKPFSGPRRRPLVWAFLGLLAFIFRAAAQPATITCVPEDREIFNALFRDLHARPGGSMGEAMIAVGKLFLGTPYKAGTLEQPGEETLVVNLRGMDCTTFVEHVLALSRVWHTDRANWQAYLRELQQIRYREGRLQGYPSRLHYFTDWIRDNARKGYVVDVTSELGGRLELRQINFMGTHPERYPALANPEHLQEIRHRESELSEMPYFLLRREAVARKEDLLQDGDIIALATSLKGLDVTHTGIAIRQRDGRIHLLHASTSGEVTITDQPLADYLAGIKGNTGILVARPQPPEP